ncbi:MAG: hypothetical protein WBL20_04700 [Sphingobium sp.]|uniref:hypothetical protein n=1 Tax=Sphingobium sp. TaxID=1912891 RepID=UPI002E219358
MPGWFRVVLDLWPIASTITPVILLAGFLWLRQKFPSKEDFDALSIKVDKIDVDQVACKVAIQALKEERDDPPTRIELLEGVAKLAERLSAVEARSEGIADQLDTANDYLQLLIERSVRR